jgi:hypothetical protein
MQAVCGAQSSAGARFADDIFDADDAAFDADADFSDGGMQTYAKRCQARAQRARRQQQHAARAHSARWRVRGTVAQASVMRGSNAQRQQAQRRRQRCPYFRFAADSSPSPFFTIIYHLPDYWRHAMPLPLPLRRHAFTPPAARHAADAIILPFSLAPLMPCCHTDAMLRHFSFFSAMRFR